MRAIATRFAALAALFLLHPETGRAQQPSQPAILSLGNAVVTGFSGTVAPDPRRVPRDKSAIDLTFIDPDAASARIFDVRTPGFVWDGRNWQAPKTFDVFARDAGQVFGIALDDEASPNIYLTATSAYGLQIVAPGADGTAQRVTKGQPRAEWMKGQFGPAQGGPGSIWKVDGRTGQVTLFANVTLNGASNAAPGLGNISYDRAHRQLFVSDLATGMIHRFDLAGREQQTYDHGTAARPARSLPPVAFDPSRRVEITDARFDSENPDSWGFAPPERRVYAVMIRQEGQDTRLYYSVWDGPQIWSIGIRPDGSFGDDPRWELDVAATPRSFPVSDMVFTDQGAMILAQRGGIVSSYDYSVFARPGEARVLRYVLEQPDDPATPSRWVARPDEYAIGFRGDFRNTDGGVDLGYGWRDGRFDGGSCATTLWTTGESLRDNPAFSTRLQPGGPFVVSGLQASPVDQVRDQNTPPWTAYFIDYDGRYNDTRASGHIGSVRILRADCAGVAGVPSVSPPYVPPVGPPPLCPQGLNPDGTCGRVPIDLAIRKTASEGKYDAATGTWTFTFTLAVTNVGNPFTAANHIVINDPAPNGLTFTAAAGTNWVCPPVQFPVTNPNALNCAYNFGPGQIATGATLPPLVITVTVKNAGKYENCATTGIAGAPWLQETTQQNNRSCATIAVPVDLAIKKTAGEPKYDPAAGTWSFQYTLTVTNVGAAISPAGPNVIAVSDPIPAGLTFTSATGSGWNCNAPPALATGALTCGYTLAGTIAHNQVLGTITVTVVTKNPGKYDNCATVGVTAASGLQETALQNNKDCATVTITRPVVDLAIKKTVGEVKYDSATGLWTFTYTLDVTNAGNPFAPGGFIAVNDPVPGGLTFTAAGGTNWACPPGQFPTTTALNCTYNFGAGQFANGAHLNQLVITVTTKTPGKYENCATVSIASASGFQETTLQNNKSCVPIEIVKSPFVPVDPGPQVNPVCGINVIFVVDISGSMVSHSGQVQGALFHAKQLFNNPPAKGEVITFSDTAFVAEAMSPGTLGTFGTYTFAGQTNWQAAMQLAASEAASAPPPVIVVFITDGIPNLMGSGVPTNSIAATNAAIPFVNQIYGSGIPIIGIGLFDTDPVNGPIHLKALLGAANVINSSFGGLYGDLDAFAKKMCPDLYLSKSISPSAINFHNTPAPQQVTVTLTLQTTSGAVTSVQVQDALPPELVNPTNFSASVGVASGNPVIWNIPTPGLAAGATATLSFKADVVKPTTFPACPSWYSVRNFAQVTAVSPAVHSTPNNMANAVTGPVHEHDEASAGLLLKDCQDVINPTLQVTKSAPESCHPQNQQSAAGVAVCTFTVTVQAVGNYTGNVTFGDAIMPSSGPPPISAGISSIALTSTPPVPATQPPYCFQSFTTTPSTCSQNVTLNSGQSISFTVTLTAPPILPAGNYKNCFMAAQNDPPPASQNWATYSTATPTSWNWYAWGYCAPFSVPAGKPAPVPPPPVCDPGTTVRRGNECVCLPGAVRTSAQACACPTGASLVPGRGCEPPIKCDRPQVPNATNTACVCPEGTLPRGRECVKPPTCDPPMIVVPGPAPGMQRCACPPGTVQRGRDCVKQTDCQPPKILRGPPPGVCECPPGTTERGRECVRQTVCQAPKVLRGPPPGVCECPPGTTERGRECVRQPICQLPMVLVPGPRPGVSVCGCPQGTVQRGRECVRPGPSGPKGGEPPRGTVR